MSAYLDESQHWDEADWARANQKLGSTLIVLREDAEGDIDAYLGSYSDRPIWPVADAGEIQLWTYTGEAT